MKNRYRCCVELMFLECFAPLAAVTRFSMLKGKRTVVQCSDCCSHASLSHISCGDFCDSSLKEILDKLVKIDAVHLARDVYTLIIIFALSAPHSDRFP